MIGNDFLRFIEDSASVRSEKILRFMDDVYLFDDDLHILKADFAEIQRLLGLKGLSVNASKTKTGGTPHTDEADGDINELKKRLLQKRRRLIVSHYGEGDETEDPEHSVVPLDEEEISFILSKLDGGRLHEDDAELILVVMRDHVDRMEEHLDQFAKGYPHLAKNFYGLCAEATNKERVASIILEVALQGDHIGEHQLFWFGMMLDSYLMNTKLAPDLINALYRHHSATDISKAKILEIEDNRFGLPEMRETYLREGRSDWLSWSSAVGSLALDKQARNYLLGYFANGSDMNRLISDILQSQ